MLNADVLKALYEVADKNAAIEAYIAKFVKTMMSDSDLVKQVMGATGHATLDDVLACVKADHGSYCAGVKSRYAEELTSAIGSYKPMLEKAVASVDQLRTVVEGVDQLKWVIANVNSLKLAVSSATSLCYLLGLPETLSAAMVENDTLSGILCMNARCLIGTGIGGHPSESGHDSIYQGIISSYENEYTAEDETLQNLIDAMDLVKYLVTEYYDDAYAYGYNYALENGYITIAQNGIAIAIDAINGIVLPEEITEESKANIYAELKAVVATLEELKVALGGQAATVDGLIETVMALEDDLYTHLMNLETFALQAGSNIYELVYLPQKAIIEEQVILAVRMAAEAMLRETYAQLVAKITEIYGIALDVNATVEEIIAAVRDHLAHITAGEVIFGNDFFYLAITDGNDGYADLVAAALGLTEEQYKKVIMEEVTAADMAQANFITVGYSGVNALNFAVEQMLGVANEYVEYVDGFVQAVDTKLETNFPKVMEMVGIDIYDTVMEVVETEAGAYLALVEGKEVAEMNWAALVGEENVAYVEAVLEELRAVLVSEGITETISYSINVVEMANQIIAENTDNLVKLNEEELYAALGEHAVFEIEVSVVDLAVFAAESALYEFISYNVEYYNTMKAITAAHSIIIFHLFVPLDRLMTPVIRPALFRLLQIPLFIEISNRFTSQFATWKSSISRDLRQHLLLIAIEFYLSRPSTHVNRSPNLRMIKLLLDLMNFLLGC